MRTLTRTTLTGAVTAGLLATVGGVGIAQAAPGNGDQTFQLHYSSSVSQDTSRVIGHGPIAGVGTDVETFTDTGGRATFTFRDGTLVVGVHITGETPTLNLSACHADVALAGSWAIESGTGAYAAAIGSGTYSGSRTVYGARIKGACQGPDSGVEPRMVTEDVTLTGNVSVG